MLLILKPRTKSNQLNNSVAINPSALRNCFQLSSLSTSSGTGRALSTASSHVRRDQVLAEHPTTASVPTPPWCCTSSTEKSYLFPHTTGGKKPQATGSTKSQCYLGIVLHQRWGAGLMLPGLEVRQNVARRPQSSLFVKDSGTADLPHSGPKYSCIDCSTPLLGMNKMRSSLLARKLHT